MDTNQHQMKCPQSADYAAAFTDFFRAEPLPCGEGTEEVCTAREASRGLNTRGALGEGSGVCCPSELDCPPAGVGSPFMGRGPPRMCPQCLPQNKGRKKGQLPSPETLKRAKYGGLRCSMPTSL